MWDGRVVGDTLQQAPRHPPDPIGAGSNVRVRGVLCVAAPLHQVADVGFGDLPGVSVGQPGVGPLDLPAIVDLLVEDAELVANAVADSRALKGGQRVQVTGGEPAETAVTQSLAAVFARQARI